MNKGVVDYLQELASRRVSSLHFMIEENTLALTSTTFGIAMRAPLASVFSARTIRDSVS
jgi:hypothetical protein